MKKDILKTPTTFEAMELKFQYRSLPVFEHTMSVSCSGDAYKYLKPLYEDCMETYECFYALYINRRNKILGHALISQGSTCATVVDPCFVILHALKLNARQVILSHNHPSGNLKPSEQDEKLTKRIKEAAKLFDITVLDHVIVTRNSYYSFADDGEL